LSQMILSNQRHLLSFEEIPRDRKKVFLGLELPVGLPISFQEEALGEVFSDWDRMPGRFPQLPMGGPNFIEYLREHIRDRLCIFDFSGTKREEDGGINLNVLLEFGLAYGLGVTCYGLINEESHKKILRPNRRISDIFGCIIYYYSTPEEFKMRLREIKVGYENPAGLNHQFFRAAEKFVSGGIAKSGDERTGGMVSWSISIRPRTFQSASAVVIENCGEVEAFDVHLDFEPLPSSDNLTFIAPGPQDIFPLEILTPGSHVSFRYSAGADGPKAANISLSWKDSSNRPSKRTWRMDL
jgi:hypothetical protein